MIYSDDSKEGVNGNAVGNSIATDEPIEGERAIVGNLRVRDDVSLDDDG